MSAALTHALEQALVLVLVLSAPPVLAVLATGVLMGFLQAATRVEDRAIGMAPKLLAALAALALSARWIGDEMVRFTDALLAALPGIGHR